MLYINRLSWLLTYILTTYKLHINYILTTYILHIFYIYPTYILYISYIYPTYIYKSPTYNYTFPTQQLHTSSRLKANSLTPFRSNRNRHSYYLTLNTSTIFSREFDALKPVRQSEAPFVSWKSLENLLVSPVLNSCVVVSFIVPEPIKTIGSSCFVRNFMNGSFGDRRSVSLQAVYDLDQAIIQNDPSNC